MITNCSNMTVYVGVTIFASCCPDGTLAGSEATRFLSECPVGHPTALGNFSSANSTVFS